MQTVAQVVAGTAGASVILLNVSPPIFYFSLGILLITCLAVCIQIIINCKRRNKRLDDLIARSKARRAEHESSNDGSNEPPN